MGISCSLVGDCHVGHSPPRNDAVVITTLWVYFYIPTNVIARRAMPDVAISYETAGDPHVAIAPRDDVVCAHHHVAPLLAITDKTNA